jgi:hypothetical protein
VLVHKAIVGAATGGLLTVVAAVLLFHPSGSERLVVAALLQVLVTLVVMGMIMRPRPKREITWAGAMLGSITLTGVLILALGSVPHEWITFADAELQWGRRDLIFVNTPAIDVSRQAVRDMIEAGLYTNTFAAVLALFLMWQRRYEMADERAAKVAAAPAGEQERERVPTGTSAFGRPVSR